MSGQSSRKWFIAIFLLALALRWGYALTLEEKPYWDDSVFLDQTARNWVAGEGLTQKPLHDTVADKEPVYPFFLGIVYWLFGHGFLVPRLIQGVLGALTAVLIAALGTRLAGRRTGILAGIIVAVYPYFVFYNGMILNETFFMLWLVLLSWFLFRLYEQGRIRHAVAAGIVLGVAILTKASLMFFIPIAAGLVLGSFSGPRRQRLLVGLAVAGIAVLIVAPWTLRNYLLLDAFVPVRTGGGQFLFESCNPIADGGPWGGGRIHLPGVAEAEGLPEVEKDRAYFRLAFAFIRENPGRMVQLSLEKLQRFWNVVPNVQQVRGEDYSSPFLRLLSAGTVTPLLVFGLVGAVQVIRSGRRRAWLFPYALIGYYTALHTVFLGSIRYRAPLVPFVILFAAFATVKLWERFLRKEWA